MVAAALLTAGLLLTPLALAALLPLLPRRPNHATRPVPTAAGLAFLPIILVTLVVSSFSDLPLWVPAYLLLAGLVGFADDAMGGKEARGFGGHLRALGRGRLTGGQVKVVGIGGGAVVVGVVLYGVSLSALAAAFLLAGFANLANLLDVRPGRAFKFLGLFVPVLAIGGGGVLAGVAGVLGGAASLFYFDLRGRIMLGDAGAAVWGAVVGCLVVARGPGWVWWAAGAAVLGLTLVAEFYSISGIIREVGALRRFDQWGRT
ncbi:hypothetical protein Rxycam_00486 [Rubrobacter xylanophilus DSM 9941]|uniref:hypothetical protein n=1 Tax=Rubrobacter xylanophilus TaxID=49319 RepID=UPI001C641E6A|nr:hypothetical protein [Rubrobacter xylanophilus]QYJ14684.1 hypothetical protein Rxycam_00486 [Rubrobacter xylanophilus DSM 9941]